MITNYLAILLAAGIAAILTGPSAADDRAQTRLCRGTLDFGIISDGVGTLNQNINTELAGLLEARSGCRIRTISMPVKRVTAELRDGRLHMSGRYFQNEERDGFLWFAHIQRTKIFGWFRSDRLSPGEASRFTGSKDLVLGITAGFSHSPKVDAIVADWRLRHPMNTVEFPDRKALFEGLLAGRTDLVLLPAATVEELDTVLNPAKIPLGSFDLTPGEPGAPGGIVFSKKRFDGETAAQWQRLVTDLCVDGSILGVFQKYFGATEEDLACRLKMD
jgi:polar amino acid transport system substrate-binding protein